MPGKMLDSRSHGRWSGQSYGASFGHPSGLLRHWTFAPARRDPSEDLAVWQETLPFAPARRDSSFLECLPQCGRLLAVQVPSDHPLFRDARSHENLVVAPHIGGVTCESPATACRAAAEKLVGFFGSSGFRCKNDFHGTL